MTPAGKKVLIVDDSRAILAILRRVVERAAGDTPPVVQTATNGQEALDAIPGFQPDLVITDWHMPGVSGIEMLQTLRQTGHDHVKVGFVTADATADRVNEASSNGASFVIFKPFNDDEMVAAVRAAMGLSGGVGARPAQPAAPAAAEDAAAAGGPPLQVEAVERLLRVALKKFPFQLRPGEPLMPKQLTPFLLRCHYGQGAGDEPSVVGLLDYPGLCIVGAGSGAANADAAIAAIAKGRPDPEVVQRATTFMRVAAKLIAGHSEADPYKMLRGQVVTRGVGELDEVLTQAGSRTDMRLSVAGCPDGRMTFLRVPG